jgi:hypothetical protein
MTPVPGHQLNILRRMGVRIVTDGMPPAATTTRRRARRADRVQPRGVDASSCERISMMPPAATLAANGPMLAFGGPYRNLQANARGPSSCSTSEDPNATRDSVGRVFVGILEALRDTDVTTCGRRRRLLDEVDVITSVSGGSYTAAYFGLFGDTDAKVNTPSRIRAGIRNNLR